jgi:hypothetical protein
LCIPHKPDTRLALLQAILLPLVEGLEALVLVLVEAQAG